MKIKAKEIKIGMIVRIKTVDEESWPKGEKEYIGWVIILGSLAPGMNLSNYISIQHRRRDISKHTSMWSSFWNYTGTHSFTEQQIKEIEILKDGKN